MVAEKPSEIYVPLKRLITDIPDTYSARDYM